MTRDIAAETPGDLFEDAPCGYVSTLPDGTFLTVNRTFEQLTGLPREELVGRRRFQDLLPVAGRIYHETHYRPLLLVAGEAREIALELVCGDDSRLPILLNSVLVADEEGRPQSIRTIVFPATDRRSYEQELLQAQRHDHEVAQRLQRSLLSGELPEAPGLELGVRYRPGVSGLEAGGDWYDAFWLDADRAVALVVGDVVGRGIGAAATMGQLRSATRALASTRMPPARLLEALDRYADTHESGEMTTIVYAELDLASLSLRYACAGHPPPVVAPPGDEPYFATGARSLPIASWEAITRADAALDLEPGTTLLLYTDGLIEHPSRSLETGMDALLRAVADGRGLRPAELAAALLDGLPDSDYVDDVCVVVARLAAR